MKTSVVIPSYNYAGFVPVAVQSVLDQDWAGEIECIVVDDGSTDDTASALAVFGGRIRYVCQDNRGMAAAINHGYRVSTGDIVCLLDADDVWKPHKVRRVLEAFEADAGVGLVHHEVEVVDGLGRPVEGFLGGYQRAVGDVAARMRRKVLPWMFNPTSTLCLRREVCHFLFPVVETLRGNADDLIAGSAALLAPVGHVAEALSYYRVHGANLWASTEPGSPGASPTPAPGRWEDVDRYGESRRYVRLAEEKVNQANQTLLRAGRPAGLTPWLDWTYVKYRAALDGVPPSSRWFDVLKGLARCDALSLPEKIGVGGKVMRRLLRSRLRKRPAGEGGAA